METLYLEAWITLKSQMKREEVRVVEVYEAIDGIHILSWKICPNLRKISQFGQDYVCLILLQAYG